MERKEIYSILNTLSMTEGMELPLELFEVICKDLPSLINLSDNLCTQNDADTLAKFLTCILYNKEK